MSAYFRQKTGRSPSPEMQRRLLRATVASAATGVMIYLLVMRWALPTLQTRLTPAQIQRLRHAFVEHPVAVLGAIVLLTALLALPVLGVFRWVSRPRRTPAARPRERARS